MKTQRTEGVDAARENVRLKRAAKKREAEREAEMERERRRWGGQGPDGEGGEDEDEGELAGGLMGGLFNDE